MNLKLFKKFKLPDNPGVYFFWKGKEIAYIGKATSLRSRVRSYFSKDLIHTRGQLLVDMIEFADNIKWQTTDSVLEALILEAELIRKHKPKYNTKDKDDKSFSYVVITREAIPKVLIMRGKELEEHKNFSRFTLPGVPGGTYATKNFHIPLASIFGPFTNGMQLKDAMKIIRPIFPYVDRDSSRADNAEFYRQIGLSPDVRHADAVVMYKKNIINLKLFFQGKKKQIIKNLERDMKSYAKDFKFEEAGEVKRQIFALKYINDVALLKREPDNNFAPFRIEAYDIAHMSGKNMVGVMVVLENNNPVKSEYKKFRIRSQKDTNDTGALREVLTRRFNHPEWTYPNLIVVDGGIAQLNAARDTLLGLGINIPVAALLKDERHKPKNILGYKEMATTHKNSIILANNEAHRFAIAYHKNMRGRNFLAPSSLRRGKR